MRTLWATCILIISTSVITATSANPGVQFLSQLRSGISHQEAQNIMKQNPLSADQASVKLHWKEDRLSTASITFTPPISSDSMLSADRKLENRGRPDPESDTTATEFIVGDPAQGHQWTINTAGELTGFFVSKPWKPKVALKPFTQLKREFAQRLQTDPETDEKK